MPKPQKPNTVRSNEAEHEQRDQQRTRIEKTLLGSQLKKFEKQEARIDREFHSSYEKLNQRLNQTDKAAQYLDQRLGKFANAGVDQAAVDQLLNQTAAGLYKNMPTPPTTRPFAQNQAKATPSGKSPRASSRATQGYSNTEFNNLMQGFDRIPALKSRTVNSEEAEWTKLEQQADRELATRGGYLDRAAFKDATRLTAKDRQEIRQEYQAMKTEALVSEFQSMPVPTRTPVVAAKPSVDNTAVQPTQNATTAEKIANATRLKNSFEQQLKQASNSQDRQAAQAKITRCDQLLKSLQAPAPKPQPQPQPKVQPQKTQTVVPKPTPAATAQKANIQAYQQATAYTGQVNQLSRSLRKTTRSDSVVKIEEIANRLKTKIQSDLNSAQRNQHSAATGVLAANLKACSTLLEGCKTKSAALSRRSGTADTPRRPGMR